MRALWSGSLSFGLINIPVKVYSASTEHTLDLDMLEKGTGRPISYQRVVKGTDKVVPWRNIVRGYKYSRGQYVILEPDDFLKADPHKTSFIEIISFSPAQEIDSIYYEKPYYVEPDKNAAKAYALLREALRKAKKVAIASFVLREREHLGVIQPEADVLVLNQLRFAADIRPTRGLDLPGKTELKPREMEMALALVDQLSAPFKPAEFKNTYIEKLLAVIEARAKGKKYKVQAPVAAQEVADESDLASILEQSLKGKPSSSRPKSAAKSIKKAAAKTAAKTSTKTAAKAAKPASRTASKAANGNGNAKPESQTKSNGHAVKSASKAAAKAATKAAATNPGARPASKQKHSASAGARA